MAEIVEYSHSQGVLHRDLKPANVLIDAADRVRITDFGLAKRLGSDSDLTTSGQVIGTPKYMSPEQAAAQHALIGPASDVYSLGSILYELVTGRAPFRSDSAIDILRQIQQEDPVRPKLLNARLPKDLETICLKCLEKEPRRRYGSAQGLADELGRYLRGEPIRARPIGRIERSWRWARRNPTVAALSGSLLALVLGVAIIAPPVAMNQALLRHDADRFADEKAALADQLGVSLRKERKAKEEANQRRIETERELKISTALRLAAQSRAVVRQLPQRSLHLAIESVELTRKSGEPILPEAEQALRDSLAATGGVPLASNRIAISGYGRLMAVAPNGGRIHLYDFLAENAIEQPRELAGDNLNVTKMILSDKGDRLVAADELGTLHVWSTGNISDRDFPIELPTTGKPINDWAISPNGRWLIIGGNPPVLFELTSSIASPAKYELGSKEGEHVEISPDSRWAITASISDPTVRLWDLFSNDPTQSPRQLPGYLRGVEQLQVYPETSFFLVTYVDGQGHESYGVWRADATAQASPHLHINDEFILNAQIDQSGRWLAALTAFGADVTNESNASRPADRPNSRIRGAGYVHSGGRSVLQLASHAAMNGPVSNRALLWQLEATEPAKTVRVLKKGTINALAFSPSGKLLGIQGSGGWQNFGHNLEIWQTSKLDREPERLGIRGMAADSISFSPDEKHVAMIDRSGQAALIGLEVRGDTPVMLHADDTRTRSIEWSGDGRFVVCVSDSESRLWSVDSGQLFASARTLSVQGKLASEFVISADRSRLSGVDVFGKVVTWDLPTLAIRGRPLYFSGVIGLKLSPQGKRLLVQLENGAIEIWSLDGPEATRERQYAPIADMLPLGLRNLAAHVDDDGGRVFSSGIDNKNGTEKLRRVDVPQSSEWLVAFSDPFEVDARWQYLVNRAKDKLQVFDLRSSHVAKPFLVLDFPGDARRAPLCFCGQREKLFAALPGRLLAWHLPSNQTIPLEYTVNSKAPSAVIASSDEEFLAVGDSDAIRLYRLDGQNLKLTHELRGHIGPPNLMTISDDHQNVAVHGQGVYLWKLRSSNAEPLGPILLSHGEPIGIKNISFTPDNRFLLAEGLPHAILWSLDLDELLSIAHKTVGRELTNGERVNLRIAE
jgi:WD40 repeat protein